MVSLGSRSVVLARALVAAALLGTAACPFAAAEDAPAPGPAPAPAPSPAAAPDESLVLGARYFDQSIAWVARGGTLGVAVDVYVHAEVKWDMEDNRAEGEQSVWFAAPDRMR